MAQSFGFSPETSELLYGATQLVPVGLENYAANRALNAWSQANAEARATYGLAGEASEGTSGSAAASRMVEQERRVGAPVITEGNANAQVTDAVGASGESLAGNRPASIGTETEHVFSQASKAEPAMPSRSGNVSQAKNCAYGFCASAQTAEEQGLVQQIKAGKDINGSLTEQVLESAAKREGYQVLDGGKYGSNNGFDLVLQHPDGSVTVVVEAKQMKDGAFQLSKGAREYVQLSERWVDIVRRRLPQDSPARLAVENAIDTQRIVTVVGGVDRNTGKIILTPVKFPAKTLK